MSEPRRFGKYEVLGKVGEGGFGTVYRGRDPVLDRTVAIKTLKVDAEETRKRFLREAKTVAGLQHPNLVTVHDFGVEGDRPYLVQEFLDGEDLSARIKRKDPAPLETRVRYLAELSEALHHAHEAGIIHRDVKPSNVRVLPDGRIKLMDFGIAKVAEATEQLTATNVGIGTVSYLAPEVLTGGTVDHRADIFSLGVLAYQLLSNALPFDGEHTGAVFYMILHSDPKPILHVAPGIPHSLAAIVEQCLAKDPDDRPETCRALAEAFKAWTPRDGASDAGGPGAEADTVKLGDAELAVPFDLEEPDPSAAKTVAHPRALADAPSEAETVPVGTGRTPVRASPANPPGVGDEEPGTTVPLPMGAQAPPRLAAGGRVVFSPGKVVGYAAVLAVLTFAGVRGVGLLTEGGKNTGEEDPPASQETGLGGEAREAGDRANSEASGELATPGEARPGGEVDEGATGPSQGGARTSSGDDAAIPPPGPGGPTGGPFVISGAQGGLAAATLSQRLEALAWDSSRFQLTGDIVSGASETRQGFFTGNATLTLVVRDREDGTTRRFVVSVGDGRTPRRVARGETAAERAAVAAVAEMAVDSVGGVARR